MGSKENHHDQRFNRRKTRQETKLSTKIHSILPNKQKKMDTVLFFPLVCPNVLILEWVK